MTDKLKLTSIFGYAAFMWVLTTISMVIGKELNISTGVYIALFILAIGSIIVAHLMRNTIVSIICSLIIPITLGLSSGPLMTKYINELGANVVFLVFIGATGIFVLAGLVGFFTKADLSPLGNYLLFALLGVIIISVIGIFFGFGEGIYALISCVSLIIFTLYTAHDVNKIRQSLPTMKGYEIPLYSLDLYLDLFNMFLDLLRIVSFFSGDDD